MCSIENPPSRRAGAKFTDFGAQKAGIKETNLRPIFAQLPPELPPYRQHKQRKQRRRQQRLKARQNRISWPHHETDN
jgi:hypothetical protein